MGVALVNPKQFFESAAGGVLANGTVQVYVANSTTPTPTWQDEGLTSLNTNPIQLDSGGSCVIWVDPAVLYKFVVYNAGGALQYTVDNIKPAEPANLRALLAASSGSSLVGFIQAGTGAVARTAQAKMRDVVSLKDFGAVCDGATDDTAAVNAAIAAYPYGIISGPGSGGFAPNRVKVTSTINLNGFGGTLKDICFVPGTANMTVLQSTTNMYSARLIDIGVDNSVPALANITAMDFTRFYYAGAELDRPFISACTNGIILRSLCTALKINCPEIIDTVNPIILLDGSDNVQINDPRIYRLFNKAIDIQQGAPNRVTGTQVLGGYIQSGDIGIADDGASTTVIGTYLETCATADISLTANSNFFTGIGTNHAAAVGPVCYMGRSAQSARIINPYMASGARSTGLFDFDATNVRCYADFSTSAGFQNVPVGTTTGLGKMATENSGTFTPVVLGTGTAGVGTYTTQSGTWRKVGQRVFADICVAWTAHTGTGNLAISGVPATLPPALAAGFQQFPVSLSGTAWTGPTIALYFDGGTTTRLSVIQTSAAGAQSLLAIPGAGTLVCTLSYDTSATV